MKNRVLPTVIVGLAGAVIGSFIMMLYASTHFANVAGPNHTPPAVIAAALSGGSDQDRIVSAVKRVEPSVVAINLIVNGQQVVPADQFFGNLGPQELQRYQARASGSGFVYKSDGEIVTNAHVVTPPNNGTISKLEVVFANGNRIPAHVVSTNIAADLAIVKVDNYAKLPPAVELANSDTLQQGQWAIAIGEPIGLQKTVTVGVVSAFDRNEPIQNESGQAITFKGLLQTSAPINPGNSGGPLVDLQGKVIGVNQSTASSVQGIGFAIPSNTVRQTVASLEQNPGVHQGTGSSYIGIAPNDLNPGLRREIGGYQGPGVAIVQVFPGTPADSAGLNPGDVIYRVDGKNITSSKQLITIISAAKPGQTLDFDTWSQGIKKLVAIKVSEKPAGYGQPQPQQGP